MSYAKRVASVIFLLFPGVVLAADYYVDSVNGSDYWTGEEATCNACDHDAVGLAGPWKTIDRANEAAFQPGDTIFLRRGRIWHKSMLTIASSGNTNNPITVDAYPKSSQEPLPIISGGIYLPIDSPWVKDSFYANDSSYDEYYMTIGQATEFVTNAPVLVRIEQNGSLSDLGNTTDHSKVAMLRYAGYIPNRNKVPAETIPKETYYLKNYNNEKRIYYRPKPGSNPSDYQFVVSYMPHAVHVSGSHVHVKNIVGVVTGISKSTYSRIGGNESVFEAYNRSQFSGQHPKNVVFENCTAQFGSNYGFSVWGENSVIRNSKAIRNRSTGIYINGRDAINSTVEYCESAYNGNQNFTTADRGGIGVQSAYATIRGNKVHNNGNKEDPKKNGGDAAISLFASPFALVERNYIFNSVHSGIMAKNEVRPGTRSDLDSWGHVIRYNVIYNWNALGTDDIRKITAIELAGYGNDSGDPGNHGRFRVYNNTIYSDQASNALVGISLKLPYGSGKISETSIINNIVYFESNASPDSRAILVTRPNLWDETVVLDYNLVFAPKMPYPYGWWFTPYANAEQLNTAHPQYAENDINSSPDFVNGKGEPFRIAATSPAVDSGATAFNPIIGSAEVSNLLPATLDYYAAPVPLANGIDRGAVESMDRESPSVGVDSDGDGLFDPDESVWNTDPENPDTDGDGLLDGQEVALGIDPGLQDTDGDGLSDLEEGVWGTNQRIADSDNDGVGDLIDNCPIIHNGLNESEGQRDFNQDGIGDACQDSDNDSLLDRDELDIHHSNPASKDTDYDGMPDGWEVRYGLDPILSADASGDKDGDSLNNLHEFLASINPVNPDTDRDGIGDGEEIAYGSKPGNVFSPNIEGWNLSRLSDFSDPGSSESLFMEGDTLNILVWSELLDYSAIMKDHGKFRLSVNGKHYEGELTNKLNNTYMGSIKLGPEHVGTASLALEVREKGRDAQEYAPPVIIFDINEK